jgi:hypothetical protein
MAEPEIQRAINETLKNVMSDLKREYDKNERKRQGDAPDNPVISERMHTYTDAIRIVANHIQHVEESNEPDL